MIESPHADPAPQRAVTLLFTDIEGSTRLWESDAARMSPALVAHDALARRAVEGHRGKVVKMIGDGMHAVFDDALDAVDATIDLQRALADKASTAGLGLRVRCGLHMGIVEVRDGDTFGSAVNRAARIMSAAHGGQVLLSGIVADAVRVPLRSPAALLDLGNVRLKDLATAEHVYQLVHPDLRQEFPALRSLESIPNNLPQQSTTFIGRGRELADLARLVAKNRIVTLTGSGGCGKTRLCLQLAADALDHYQDGVWLVELAPLSEPGLVAFSTATALGLKEEPGKAIAETLAEHLADRRLLLLLDNCEHLLDAVATMADALLRRSPGLRIIATSREALGIAGEQSYRVPSLSVPEPKRAAALAAVASCEAVQLFVDRAALVRADFALSDANAGPIASICSRLDGIPLAIELAAARVRSLTVEEIDGKLNERFRLLTGGSRTALPRQQTLRSLIDWSYDLLSDAARHVLQRLAVFAGGWTLDAAERVCAGEGIDEGDVLGLLTSLVDKSLVAADERDGGMRYRLVETVRQYAREKLLDGAGGTTVRNRHLDFFVTFAEDAKARLLGAETASWLRRLDEEYDNLRMALEWSLSADPHRGLALCGALQRFWIAHAHFSEGREWCARVLAATPNGGSPEHADVHNCAGLLAYHQHDYAMARASLEASLDIRRAARDTRGIAIALNNLGMVALDQGDLAAAGALHRESLALAREVGNRNGVARSLANLGMVECAEGDYAAARLLFEESHAILRELGDREGVAIVLHSLADTAFEQGEWSAAGSYFSESLAILRELDHRVRIVFALEGVGALVAAQHEAARAARLWGAAQRVREDIGTPLADDAAFASRVAAARASLGDAAFDAAWAEGRALTLDQAVELASRHRPTASARSA
jgi:predicted ATPase/class 3 adenylate cyclase